MRYGQCAFAALIAFAGASCAGPAMQTRGAVELPTQMPDVGADEIATEKRRQQVFALQSFSQQTARVQNVAHRLLVANRSDCKNVITPRPGFSAFARNELSASSRDIIGEALNLDAERATVVSVVEGGPAAKAGLLPGDVLLTFNGVQIPSFKPSQWLGAQMHRNGNAPIRLETLRQGKPHTRTVQPEMGCAIPVLVAPTVQANASTDGRHIVIHAGVLRLAPTDAELAAVLAHELAHVTMGHLAKRAQVRAAAVGGFMFGGDPASAADANSGYPQGIAQFRAFTIETEREADYVGTYYVARAGYDLGGGERVWRALAQENPRQIIFAGMHPTGPERVLLIQKTVQEIAEKKRRKLPLDPEIRARQAAGTDQ